MGEKVRAGKRQLAFLERGERGVEVEGGRRNVVKLSSSLYAAVSMLNFFIGEGMGEAGIDISFVMKILSLSLGDSEESSLLWVLKGYEGKEARNNNIFG